MELNAAFASDNVAGVHPKILQAMNCANAGYVPSYGDDSYTERASKLLRGHFGDAAEIFPVLTGTAANVLCLKSVCQSFQAVICAQSSHLQHHECGAPEAFLGSKLLLIPDIQGKISSSLIEETLEGRTIVHYVQPRVVSISQCTEWGTVYTVDEIGRLADYCHQNDLLLHVDGARLTNAAASLKCTFKEMILDTGVDLLSFGGTKCGCMGAEAAIILRPELAQSTPYFHKQVMQLSSKMRYISVQLSSLLENDLWRDLAEQANLRAAQLYQGLLEIPEIRFSCPVETNALFTHLPQSWVAPLQKQFSFVIWNSQTPIIRWMTSFATMEAEVEDLISACSKLSQSTR